MRRDSVVSSHRPPHRPWRVVPNTIEASWASDPGGPVDSPNRLAHAVPPLFFLTPLFFSSFSALNRTCPSFLSVKPFSFPFSLSLVTPNLQQYAFLVAPPKNGIFYSAAFYSSLTKIRGPPTAFLGVCASSEVGPPYCFPHYPCGPLFPPPAPSLWTFRFPGRCRYVTTPSTDNTRLPFFLD